MSETSKLNKETHITSQSRANADVTCGEDDSTAGFFDAKQSFKRSVVEKLDGDHGDVSADKNLVQVEYVLENDTDGE